MIPIVYVVAAAGFGDDAEQDAQIAMWLELERLGVRARVFARAGGSSLPLPSTWIVDPDPPSSGRLAGIEWWRTLGKWPAPVIPVLGWPEPALFSAARRRERRLVVQLLGDGSLPPQRNRSALEGDRYVVASRAAAERLRGELGAEAIVEVIAPGVDCARFDLRTPVSREVPLFVGWATAGRWPILLGGFRGLRRRRPARLLVVGDVPEGAADELREAGVDRDVALLGRLAIAERARLFAEADAALVVGSDAALLEVAAAGLPIAALPDGLAAELAAVGGGIVAASADGEGLAQAALALPLADAMGTAARDFAEARDLRRAAMALVHVWQAAAPRAEEERT